MKYSDLNKIISKNISNQNYFELEDDSKERFPCSSKNNDEFIFLDIYESLDTISNLHRNEKYFEQEIIKYNKIQNDQTKLKSWILNNEKLGSNTYVCFLLDYLDYDIESKVKHLNVFIPSLPKMEIYIEIQDFKNTLIFLEIFNDLYWIKEMIPESLEKIINKYRK